MRGYQRFVKLPEVELRIDDCRVELKWGIALMVIMATLFVGCMWYQTVRRARYTNELVAVQAQKDYFMLFDDRCKTGRSGVALEGGDVMPCSDVRQWKHKIVEHLARDQSGYTPGIDELCVCLVFCLPLVVPVTMIYGALRDIPRWRQLRTKMMNTPLKFDDPDRDSVLFDTQL